MGISLLNSLYPKTANSLLIRYKVATTFSAKKIQGRSIFLKIIFNIFFLFFYFLLLLLVFFYYSTNGHPWDSQVSDLHKGCNPLHFQLPLQISFKKKKVKRLLIAKGVGSVH